MASRLLNAHLDRKSLQRDVRVDTFRAGGPGGQHLHKTESAVRLVHVPTGITVTVQETRSQARNRELAWERLIARLQQRARKPKARVATKASRAVKERRLREKRQRGQTKRERRARPEE